MKGSAKTTEFSVLSMEEQFLDCAEVISRVEKRNAFIQSSYLKYASLGETYPVVLMTLKENGRIALAPYVKRRINDLPFMNDSAKAYWDLISPFEFASVFTNAEDKDQHKRLTAKLMDAVASYCRENSIVCEFVRFDPFVADADLFDAHYKLSVKKNVCIDLSLSRHDIQQAYHRSVKKNLNRAVASGLRFEEVEKNSRNIAGFIELYWHTLRRLNAKRYYYFSEFYFQAMLGHCNNAALFFVRNEEGHPIAASIVLHAGGIAYHHLTGSDTASLHLRPNDFMIHCLVQWAADKGLRTLHLGGGVKTIRDFKSKFSGLCVPYYTGRRIHDQHSYDRLCDKWRRWAGQSSSGTGFTPDPNFFPLYRNGCR